MSDSKKYVEIGSEKYLRADSDPLLQASMDAQNRNPRETGCYTLEEAAIEILKGSGEITGMELEVVREERINTVVKMLKEDVANRSLTVYDPGSNIPRQPKIVREFFEEVNWDDLNLWLENSLPRINWRFPAPTKRAGQSDHTLTYQPNPIPDTSDSNSDSEELPEWKRKAWQYGMELLDKYPERDVRSYYKIGVKSIGDTVAVRMKKEKFLSAKGTPFMGSYIARHALGDLKKEWKKQQNEDRGKAGQRGA